MLILWAGPLGSFSSCSCKRESPGKGGKSWHFGSICFLLQSLEKNHGLLSTLSSSSLRRAAKTKDCGRRCHGFLARMRKRNALTNRCYIHWPPTSRMGSLERFCLEFLFLILVQMDLGSYAFGFIIMFVSMIHKHTKGVNHEHM